MRVRAACYTYTALFKQHYITKDMHSHKMETLKFYLNKTWSKMSLFKSTYEQQYLHYELYNKLRL